MGKTGALAKELRRLLAIYKLEHRAERFSHRFSPKAFTVAQLKVLQHFRFIARTEAAIKKLRATQIALHKRLHPNEPMPGFAPLPIRRGLRNSGATSYRRIVRMLHEHPELREAMEMTKVPHFSTLAHFDHRHPFHTQ